MEHNETQNKLTLDDIEAQIVSEESVKLGEKTCIVLLKLRNGFEVIGHSGVIIPENYNHEIGVRIARQRAVDKVWELEGYRFQQSIYLQKIDAKINPTSGLYSTTGGNN